jgi:hypothetical protein
MSDIAKQLNALPEYKSNATDKERDAARIIVRRQTEYLYKEHHMTKIKIHCPCGKRDVWSSMFRCLYCGIFFCKECAQIHFGYRVEATKPPSNKE